MRLRTLALVALLAGTARAGTGYEVTATGGGKPVTYRVKFGGGRRFDQWTAFDPQAKTFVYLRFDRGQDPKPAATIWDHRTGETVKLYTFPGVEQPLLVIPTLEEMKVCPLTGDKKFSARPVLAYD